MQYHSIRGHLRPYSIFGRRKTTINHAFASAIAPCDAFDEASIREAIVLLDQDPDHDLRCSYCGAVAETWDHVFATVSNSEFSGFGHRLGNLLPCCKPCTSRKGNKNWLDYIHSLRLDAALLKQRTSSIRAYLERFEVVDVVPRHLPQYRELQQLRTEVLALFARADQLAAEIRAASEPRATSSPG